mgnify:FL=1
MNQPANQLSLEEHQQLVLWAVAYAQQVLHLFEDRYPDDHRPRNALSAAKKWVEGELSANEVRRYASAAQAAAHDADDSVASAVALSAGYAASTVQFSAYAPHVATYAMQALSSEVSRNNLVPHRLEKRKSRLLNAFRGL